MPKQIQTSTADRWKTADVAQHLRASMRSVQNYRDYEGLPHLRINARKFLYVPSEVAAWARARSRKSNGQ